MNYENLIATEIQAIKDATETIYKKTGLKPIVYSEYSEYEEKTYLSVSLNTTINAKSNQEIQEEITISDTVEYLGDCVKMADDGSVEGYLVRFTDKKNRDLDGEYFTNKTYLGESTKLTMMYNHGFNDYLGKLPIGAVEVTRDNTGIYVKGKLDTKAIKDFFSEEEEKADKYIKDIIRLGKKGKLGWSSGAPMHTIQKTTDGEIKQWILSEASLTPTPAEPKNRAFVKSVKVGSEYSNKNKEKLKELAKMSQAINEMLADITKDFDTEEVAKNASVNAGKAQTFINLIGA